MKFFNNNLSIKIIFLICTLTVLFLNHALNIYPFRELFRYLVDTKYYWLVPTFTIIFIGFLLFYISMRKKVVNGKIEMFNATIRTVQDVLQNSYSSLQLLILDMKDENVDPVIVHKTEKNLEEMHKAIKTLAGIDPENIKLEELNKKLSIIRMRDTVTK